MGQKRITTSISGAPSQPAGDLRSSKKSSKKQVFRGLINIFSSYNNTIVSVGDANGNILASSSSGSLGFKGSRKSTPYAATLVGKDVVEKTKKFGLQEVKILVSGIGPGREAAIRGIASTGMNIISIVDTTPIPHNGVRAPKPRRV